MGFRAIILFACLVVYVNAHGALIDPPNRASLWRFGYNAPQDFDDFAQNCGGIARQHSQNGGKCGVCGDPYDEPQPRKHELGGPLGIGIIVATYKAGQLMPAQVKLGFSHYGFWELRICPHAMHQEQECFENGYLLELEEGATKYFPRRGAGTYNITYRLPSNLTCKHCVLQWQYTTGINWGICVDGTRGLQCGQQEHFFSCSDISIEPNDRPTTAKSKATDQDISDVTESPKSPARTHHSYQRYLALARGHAGNGYYQH